MSFSIVSITFMVGLALIVIALLGGGIEVKEIKIPALGIFPRVISFTMGIAILALCFFWPEIFPDAERRIRSDKNRIPAAPLAPPPATPSPPSPQVSGPSPSLVIASPQPNASWYVMLGSFAASNGVLAVDSAERVKKLATEECHVSARVEPTINIEGFRPGYVSSFLGPYDTQTDAAADKEKVLACIPSAYLRSVPR